MPDPAPSHPLAERALARLRRLADGNGLKPSDIVVFDSQEQILTLKGKMEISPLCETESASYAGPAKRRQSRLVGSFGALKDAAVRHRENFRKDSDWIEATVRELTTHESKGWGLQSAKVTLPEKSAVYAATEVCPTCQGSKTLTCDQCQGRGTVTCTQCQGRGRELCYYCMGSGEDPQRPGQPCFTCGGTKYAPCRFCKTYGYLPCPTCNGTRGLRCTACQGAGSYTQEVAVTCGAETHFSLLVDELPSGMRRGLDRIGIANLGKGHAEIKAFEADKGKDKEDGEDAAPRMLVPVLLYEATLPYAEMKMDFGGKKALVSVVGKRCAITGVPNFLDHALKPWCTKLRMAAFGQASLEDALQARAMRDVLSLTVAGKGTENNVRRLYPFGLSTEAINTLLTNMRLALKKTTLMTRTIMALACGALCAAFFYFLFVMGGERWLLFSSDPRALMALDFTLLGAAMAASWVILNFSTRFVLKQRFPEMPHALKQKTGKTGASMLAGIAVAFAAVLALAPVKPLWLAVILARF